MAIAYDVTFFARLSGFCVAAICGNIQSRFTFLMMIVKEEDGTVKSLCVGTQGWLSHKMLPLPGKRAMVCCCHVLCYAGVRVKHALQGTVPPFSALHGHAAAVRQTSLC